MRLGPEVRSKDFLSGGSKLVGKGNVLLILEMIS